MTKNKEDKLLAFIKQEVPFRLREVLKVPEEKITGELINACTKELYDNSDIMFDYDSIDGLLSIICNDINAKCEEITTVCYDKKEVWHSRDKALRHFIRCMSGSEGSECERYVRIYTQLMEGLDYCTDEEE